MGIMEVYETDGASSLLAAMDAFNLHSH